MTLKVTITLLGVAVCALAMPRGPAYSEVKVAKNQHGHQEDHEHRGPHEPENHEKHASPHVSYKFSYKVEDPSTHDFKGQHEVREGDHVYGEYWLVEPDGAKRTVKYHTDEYGGFNALVIRTPAYNHNYYNHDEHVIDNHHGEQEKPAEEPAPVEEAALEEEHTIAEHENFDDKPEMNYHKKPSIVDYKIHHPAQYKHEEKKHKMYYHGHGAPKYYQGSYRHEHHGGGEERDGE